MLARAQSLTLRRGYFWFCSLLRAATGDMAGTGDWKPSIVKLADME